MSDNMIDSDDDVELESLKEKLVNSTRHNFNSVVWMMAILIYVALSFTVLEDINFFSGQSELHLPIFNFSISAKDFLFVVPFCVAFFHWNLLIHLNKHKEVVSVWKEYVDNKIEKEYKHRLNDENQVKINKEVRKKYKMPTSPFLYNFLFIPFLKYTEEETSIREKKNKGFNYLWQKVKSVFSKSVFRENCGQLFKFLSRHYRLFVACFDIVVLEKSLIGFIVFITCSLLPILFILITVWQYCKYQELTSSIFHFVLFLVEIYFVHKYHKEKLYPKGGYFFLLCCLL